MQKLREKARLPPACHFRWESFVKTDGEKP
jgi:hypothetical protein